MNVIYLHTFVYVERCFILLDISKQSSFILYNWCIEGICILDKRGLYVCIYHCIIPTNISFLDTITI